MLNVKNKYGFVWGENGPKLKLENFHRRFQHEMAHHSSNFENKLQMMVGIGKEYGFTSNFDMPWPFIPRKAELPRKTELQPIKLAKASCIPE